jgi:hypothetical protein
MSTIQGSYGGGELKNFLPFILGSLNICSIRWKLNPSTGFLKYAVEDISKGPVLPLTGSLDQQHGVEKPPFVVLKKVPLLSFHF